MTLIWIIIGIAVLLIGLPIFGLSVVYRNPRQQHRETPKKFNIPYQAVRFPTKNKRHLYGWWIPNKNPGTQSSTLILVHGWGRNVERMMTYIQHLHPLRYHLLVFDARNHGRSDRDGHSTMVKFAEDILAALDFIQEQPNVNPGLIGVIGLSIGGSSALYAASLDSRIKAVVTVGAFAHPTDVMRLEFQKRHVPYFPLIWLMIKYVELRIGKSFDKIAPVNTIGNTPARILLVHGVQDAVIPIEHGERLSQAGNPESVAFWPMPDRGHSDCHKQTEFWSKIDSFFKKSFFIDKKPK